MTSSIIDYNRSQKTNGLVIEDGGNGVWIATLDTPSKATELDEWLFSLGITFYAVAAESNLAKR